MSHYPYSYSYPYSDLTLQNYHSYQHPLDIPPPPPPLVQNTEVCEEIPNVNGSEKTNKINSKWSEEETAYLVQLWSENLVYIESKDTRKAWAKIAVNISQKFGVVRSADQCSRKIKYLKDKYKECKDWNKNQTGGNVRKSTLYDELDEVLGCRDSQTLTYIEEVGTKDSLQKDLDGSDGSTSTSSETDNPRQVPASFKNKEERTERKKNMKRRVQEDREEEDRKHFKDTMEQIKAQGEILS